jgi:hypothetical protein
MIAQLPHTIMTPSIKGRSSFYAFHFTPPQTPPETIDFPQDTGTPGFAGNRFRGPFPRNPGEDV